MNKIGKIFKCPFCNKKYNGLNINNMIHAKLALYEHIDLEHKELLGTLSPSQAYFNFIYKKHGGKCVVDSKPTKWNNITERYERFCCTQCELAYKELFKHKMLTMYGKEHLLNEPEMQIEMLQHRRISGEYKWKNGFIHKYTGSYEKKFLEFCENNLNWENPEDICMPAPKIIEYDLNNEPHFYIPDCYITSIDLLIEIKGSDFDKTGDPNSNKHEWRKREAIKEELKDRKIEELKLTYIKIIDNNFEHFHQYINEIKNEEL